MGIFSGLSNADVQWDGTYIGLVPILVNDQIGRVLDQGDNVVPELIDALTDENLFVIAHVLLTKISGVEHAAFPAWNGLVVELTADGTVKIEPEQRFGLANRWRRWYHTQPRPTTLPSVQ